MRWIVFFLLSCVVTGTMYIRIASVEERISNFLAHHQINNCFERLQGEHELHLKCLREGELVNVFLSIGESIYI